MMRSARVLPLLPRRHRLDACSRRSTPERHRVATTANLITATLLLSACAGVNSSENDTPNTIRAVATTTQVCDYLTHIAEEGLHLTKTDPQGQRSADGDGEITLNLTCLLAPNASAHEHEMTPQQMKALHKADLLFLNGVNLEDFLDSAIASSGFKGVMAVTSGVTRGREGNRYTVALGEEQVKVRPWPFAREGETADFTHDPHVWTDPARAAVQVRNIGAVLEETAREKGTGDAATHTVATAVDTYAAQLADLDQWARASINTVPQRERTLFTSHDAFGYFADSYDITFIGAALSDFNHQHDATAAHIAEAAKKVKASGARTLFAENSSNDKSIEAIARAADVTAIIGDESLYGDSLGPAGSPGETYIGSIIHNVTTLVETWGGTVTALPDSLKGRQ